MRSGALVSAMTQLSRVLGLIRDVVIAQTFAAGVAADAFFVAFKIPNFLRRLFAEGAFSQAFVPVFTEYKEKCSLPELRELASRTAGTLGAILLLVTTAGMGAAPLLIIVFAPGFVDEPARFELAGDMLRITFTYLFFISLTAFAGGMLNSFHRFAVPAATPVLLNLCLIGAALGLAPYLERPVLALAWGVLAAGIAQLAFQLPFLWRLGLLPRPRWGWHHPGVKKIVRLMLPAIFGSSVAQVNLLLDTIIASFLTVGSISWLYYSDRLVEFPLGIFGIALATVLLPNLSAKHAKDAPEDFARMLDWALRLVALIAIPAMLGLVLLAIPILTTVYQYQQFSGRDTLMASYSLLAYSLGLPGFILIKVLATGFFARQNTRTPVRIGIVALVANMGFNVILVLGMVGAGFEAPHMGLALATALSAWLQAGLLYHHLHREGVYRPGPQWRWLWPRIALGAALMTLTLLGLGSAPEEWASWVFWQRALHLVGLIIAGAVAYFAILWVAGLRLWHLKE
jgi:putative peptidoglycan lipid II flippase